MLNKKSGFTLIELLMVIAIVGILAAVALPIYRGHVVTAKLAEVENAMSAVASGTAHYYNDQNSWPNCPTMSQIGSSLGVMLGAIGRVSSISVAGGSGMITATVQNVHPMVDNKTLTLTPSTRIDGSITWNWGSSVDFPPNLGPRVGRESLL